MGQTGDRGLKVWWLWWRLDTADGNGPFVRRILLTEKDDAPKSKSKAAAKPKASKKGAAEAKPEVENQAGCDDGKF